MTTENQPEIQDIFIETISDIVLANSIEMPVYTSVPNTATLPYIKIDSIKSGTNITIDPNIFLATFNILAFDNSLNNKLLTHLAELLSTELCTLILGKSQDNTTIKNAFLGECTVSEITEKRAWQYQCSINVIYRKT